MRIDFEWLRSKGWKSIEKDGSLFRDRTFRSIGQVISELEEKGLAESKPSPRG